MRISYLPAAAALLMAFSFGPLQAIGAEKAPVDAAHSRTAPVATPSEGKVISATDASIYTYMELEGADGKRFWIAGPTTKVKVGDKVRFAESMVMEKFTSKTLNRTFDRIVFVSSASIVK